MKLHVILLTFSLTLLIPFGQGQDVVEVNVPDLGVIQGKTSFTIPQSSSRPYFSFSGIPYAKPESYTAGNRFRPSEIWDGPLRDDGTKFIADDVGIRCPQVDVLNGSRTTDLAEILRLWGRRSRDETLAETLQVSGTENCLVLNVNTPKIPTDPNDPTQLLPVIVFIHGGSWSGLWGGIFGGERFLNKDVVYISINYRLGILGSLNLGIEEAPGNAAMYDIITALKWVKKYVRHWGGDNTKITVAGQSAGAMLASHLLTTDLIIDADNQPLIHGLIALSGSSLSPIATCTDPMTHHLRIAIKAGCYSGRDTDTPIQDVLRNIRACMANTRTPEQLITAMGDYARDERYDIRFGMDARVPSLQPANLGSVPIFMSQTPFQALQKPDELKLKIPILMGATRHDGGFMLEDTYQQYLKPHNYTNDPLYMRNDFLPDLLEGLGMKDPSGELAHSLGQTYLGEEIVYTNTFEPKIPGYLDIHSALLFKAPAYQLVEMNSKENTAKSYYFSFNHKGIWTLDGGEVAPGGVGHIDSLFYLFKAYSLTSSADLEVSNRFVNYWTNFAIHKNPNGDTARTLAPPYNPINHAYLVIKNPFDYTAYYCRDSWAGASVELIEDYQPEDPTTSDPNTSTETTTTEGSETTPDAANTISLQLTTLFASVLISLKLLY